MNNKLQHKDAKLYQRIDEVVHYLWDPIGISDSPGARDEYHSYLTGIYGNVKADDLDGLLEYMRWVTEHMGLQFDKTAANKAADVMFSWKRFINN